MSLTIFLELMLISIILSFYFSDEVYLENLGQPVIFAWVERIREFLVKRRESKIEVERCLTEETMLENLSLQQPVESSKSTVKCPEILTGDCIEDRKSVFQVSLEPTFLG